MAVHLATTSDYLKRTTSLLPASGNSTVCFWAKFPTVSTSPTHQVAYAILDNPAVYTQYTAIYANSANSILQGTGPLTVNGTTPTAGTWVHYAWTQFGTTQRLSINGSTIGTFTLNRAAFANGFELMGGDTITTQTDVTIAYVREWTTDLSVSQIQTEMLTTTASHLTSLYMDCPLESNLLDTSGHGHDWTQIGSGSFVAGPAPSNHSGATALAISSLPYSTTQVLTPIMDAWYSYTATADAVVSVFGFGDLTNYKPYNFVYSPSSSVVYPVLSDTPLANVPIQFAVETGVTYWFQFTSSTSFVGTGTLTLSAEAHTPQLVPAGSILVNNDKGALRATAAFLSSVDGDDYNVLDFIDVVAGEGGDVLSSNGQVLLSSTDGTMVLYSDDLSAVLTTLTFGPGTGGVGVFIRANQTTQRYYAGQVNFTHAPQFQKILSDGTMSSFATLSNNGLGGFAVSDDEATIFLTGNPTITSSNIRQWSVGGAAFGADLVASVANYEVSDLLLMGDSTLLAMYRQTFSPGDIYVKRYNSTTGATLNTYMLASGVTIPSNSFGYRLAFASDDPTSFWAWFHLSDGGSANTGISRFQNVRVSDGVVLTSVDAVEYENGSYFASASATPLARFGPSRSCPFIILRGSETPVAESVEYLIRRERWFPHIGQEQLRQFFSKLQIDLYAGNGISTGQGSDPLLEIDWSDDGGHTWSDIHFVQTGAIGAFRTRAILRRMGSSRDRVYRIACSDPVQWSVVNGYLDATLGLS